MILKRADILCVSIQICLLMVPSRMSSQPVECVSAMDSIAHDSTGVAQIKSDGVLESNVEFIDGTLLTNDSIGIVTATDSITKRKKRDWATWRPNAKRAMWLALVIPGAGQIYNRKYWKVPIVYGGFVGCIYAMRWNNQMYHDYSQAYLDLMDDDPTTQSYNEFLHLGATIDDSNLTRYQNLFKKRKDKYRRWRDLSFFCLVGVYALSVIDAYVDASLSEFDISKNLSMRVEPTIMDTKTNSSPLRSSTLGLSCSLNF